MQHINLRQALFKNYYCLINNIYLLASGRVNLLHDANILGESFIFQYYKLPDLRSQTSLHLSIITNTSETKIFTRPDEENMQILVLEEFWSWRF